MTEPEEQWSRPDWDNWALGLAFAVSLRADCRRARVGAVILNSSHRVISTGYNGTAPGRDGCLKGNCPRGHKSYAAIPRGAGYDQPGDAYCIATHAEMNALLYADPLHLPDASLYCTIKPCDWCMKVIGNTPIRRVVHPEPDIRPEHYFRAAAYELHIDHKVVLV